MDYDIVIKNGKIINGTGNPWFYGDIAINEERITNIAPKLTEDAQHVINAKDLYISPGFIDMHSHSDIVLPFNRKMESFINQGITTAVCGMCGIGLAPVNQETIGYVKKSLSSFIPMIENYTFKWRSFEEYLDVMEKVRCPTNLCFFIPYSNIRIASGAAYEEREVTENEIEKMIHYIKKGMSSGAFGLSTGLIYTPQTNATTKELIRLCEAVASFNGLYFSHIRGEGKSLIKAVKEFVDIVEDSGVIGGQIGHHKSSGKFNWGKSEESLRLIKEANERGLSITLDQYPYKRSMTSLITLLPPWVHEGGISELLERIKNPKIQEKIKTETQKGSKTWENSIGENGFQNIYLAFASSQKWKIYEGKRISSITKSEGFEDGWETVFEILVAEEGGGTITEEAMCEEDVQRIMQNRFQMFGTDGIGIPINPKLGKYHPRFYGTYPRILGTYVKEKQILSLEDAIRKMTSFPAQRLGLVDRGLIKENFYADLVVFDFNKIRDKSTYENPAQKPDGIEYVIINGEIVINQGKQQRKYPGKVLRKIN
ncbi:MAG: amidohydrolase family protein [Candidatus Lokiarchaeota archaeon]|nr:amidohydrolase family protein [Candidatus Lokiarchaeota archaeon]MBD3202404.1 amidohydrolase family protein [Candidatus Lokiarchaeota archaeon]